VMTFRELVTAVLSAVERDAPECGRLAAAELSQRCGVLRVDDEVMTLSTRSGRLVVDVTVSSNPEIEVATTGRAMVDVVDGIESLLDAIERDRMQVTATAEDMLALDAAIRWVVIGAMRCEAATRAWTRHRSSQIAHERHGSAARTEAA